MDIENIDGFIQMFSDYMLYGNGDPAQIAFWKAYSEMVVDKVPDKSHTKLCLQALIDGTSLPEVIRRGSALTPTPSKKSKPNIFD